MGSYSTSSIGSLRLWPGTIRPPAASDSSNVGMTAEW